MTAAISLVERRAAPAQEGVVALLERALEEARTGKLKAVVLIRVDHADNFQCTPEGDLRLTQIVGLMEVAKHDALELERARPPVED